MAVGLLEAVRIPGRVGIFFNMHPSEILDVALVESLADTAAEFRRIGRRLVLEVHEDAITNTSSVRQLHEHLRELDIGLAFDDFAAGQTRLAELAEAAPDFIKLDMKLIRGIDQSMARQDLVGTLAELAASLNVQIVAEGVETRPEADACRLGSGCSFACKASCSANQPPSRLLSHAERHTNASDDRPGIAGAFTLALRQP